MKKYIPLWCKSNFSFLEGASHPEELSQKCIDLNIPAFALTDRDGVYGIVRAHEATKKHATKLIIGSELTVADSSNNKNLPTESIILLAQNKIGYANLCKLISRGRLRSPKGHSLLTWNEICEYSSNLIALWGGRKLLLTESYSTWLQHATQLQEAFCSTGGGKTGNRIYSLITRHYLPKDNFIETNLSKLSAKIGIPVTGTTEILYHEKNRKPVQDVLTCIRYKTTLNKSGSLLKPNDQHYIKSPFEFYNLFADRPDLAETSLQIAEQCNFSLSELNYNYPSELLPNGYTSLEWLTHIALEGAKKRYRDNIPSQVLLQLNKEIGIIGDLDYCGYFLTMYEIVKFCNSHNILCQGRGSAANSIVCYCLEITAIDPVKMELLFERFLSKERAEPPDIDLDIEHHRREEVINFVYTKYGIDHAAMVANIVRYRTKSAIRDIGKTLEIPNASLEKITQSFQEQEKKLKISDKNTTKKSTSYLKATDQHLLIELVTKIQRFPRHLSIHPGGFLLGNEPIYNFVPIENTVMKNRTVIQWDKTDIESLSLFKLDLLGLGALTQINLSFDLIRHYYKSNQTMATISFKDKSVFDMISSNDTIGVFQIESRAQMSILPRLQPRTFYDLVIQVALVRPGPITGKMVHPYLKRRNGEEPIEYPHPKLRPILIKTLGIPLFQEQVMKIAITAANYTAEEANQLRRDMNTWQNSNNIEKHERKFVSRMIKTGSSKKSARLIFNQIRGFGEYGFPESHAASFALIAYTSAWIKHHYHDIFTVALLNSWPMGFYNRSTLLADACKHGIKILPIDISISEWQCTLEKPTWINSDKENVFRKTSTASIQNTLNFPPRFAIRIGLKFLNGLSKNHAEKIVNERKKQPFKSVQDMALRLTSISSKILIKLAESGSLNSLSRVPRKQPLVIKDDCRRENLWLVLEEINRKNHTIKNFSRKINDIEFSKSTPEKILSPIDRLSKIHWDYLSLGYSIHGHPTELLQQQIKSCNSPNAEKILIMRNGQEISYVGMVICRQKPKTAAGVVFITLEDKSGLVNIIVWPKIFKKFGHIILNSLFLGVDGTIQRKDNSMVYIIAQSFWKLKLHDS